MSPSIHARSSAGLILAAVMVALISTEACGAGGAGAPDAARAGSGGTSTSSDSGAPGSGGATSSGGVTGSDGVSASGGSTQSGGANGTGGAASGGQTASGGANVAGSGGARPGGAGGSGATTVATGGGPAGGGAPGSGGRASATGGAGTGVGGGGGGASQSTIVPDPSWTCGMPDGIPAPTKGTLVFHATLQVGMSRDAGMTNFGRRRVIDIKGGTTTGTRLQATFLTGGYEFELTLSNGTTELEQVDILRASDGTLIYMRSCGVAPAGSSEVRIVPDFEVATSKSALAWLNTGKFVGTRVIDSAGAVQLDIYDVASVVGAAGDPRIRLTDPTDKPQQPWDCNKVTGGKGATVFTENVTLGSSLSVGAGKRGTRNIIPITGGTVSGRFAGTVLPGGADYQLVGGTTTLDARYVLLSSDGVVLVVRNCGPFGALVPTFETRSDGPYAFLNTSAYVSSDPGSAGGGVTITFYERK